MRIKKTAYLVLALIVFQTMNAQNWQHVGPLADNNFLNASWHPGRVWHLRAHPSYDNSTNKTVYAVSESGGFYVSTNAGANWNNINTDYMKYSGASDVAIDETNSTNNILYVTDINEPARPYWAKSYNSSGVYKYSTGTSTWAPTGAIPYNSLIKFRINSIKIHPYNKSWLYLCTTDGIFWSTNAGSNWTRSNATAGVEYEDLVFVPKSGLPNQYFEYATGWNTFMKSSDDAVNFSTVTSMTNLWSTLGLTSVYSVCSRTNVSTGVDDIFFMSYTSNSSNVKAFYLFKYEYDQNSSIETSTTFHNYTEYDVSYLRLAITAYSPTLVFFGSVDQYYYDLSTGMYDYCSAGHTDTQDFLSIPSTNQVFCATDGGVYLKENFLVSNPCQAGWARQPNGMDISQLWGFGSSEEDPDYYLTGEADGAFGGMMFSDDPNCSTNCHEAVGGNEHAGGVFDYYDGNYAITDYSAYSPSLYGKIINHDPLTYQTNLPWWQDPNYSDFCHQSTTVQSQYFQYGNMPDIFQNIYRPGKIYFCGSYVYELCKNLDVFISKFRPSSVVPVNWGQQVNQMGFAKWDHNKVYFTLKNIALQNRGEVLKFSGTNFDDCWVGHNETNSLQVITPNFTTGSNLAFSVNTVSTSDEYSIWYTGIAVSELNSSRFWVGCHDVPNNPLIKVLKYENGTWYDYSGTGIPGDEFPTWMVYEQGSNDGVYIGTNRGVYYRNATMSYWANYSAGLPHLAVSQMDINYKENTIRVGTFGRGIWKSSLYCPTTTTLNISGVTYSTDQFKEVTQWIKTYNSTVTGGDVRFRAGEYIDLLPNTSSTYFAATSTGSSSFLAYIHNCNTPGNSFRESSIEDAGGTEISTYFKEDQNQKSRISAFPNPSNGVFTIQRSSEEGEKEYAQRYDQEKGILSVYNSMGELLFLKDFEGETMKVDLSNYSKGIYVVNYFEGGKLSSIKIIRQ